MGEEALELSSNNLKFLDEVIKTEIEKPAPKWTTPSKVIYDLHTFTLRDFSNQEPNDEIPVIILPPYAGHTSVIVDFNTNQSLVESLIKNGINRVLVVDWKSATEEMKDYDVDNYLAELHIAICDIGGRVHLIGICQGGWFASIYAARFPACIASIVLAGAPIDTQAGNGQIKKMVKKIPFIFYELLVKSGGGLLKGSYMLNGFKNMHPQEQYIDKYIDLYKHINDEEYVKRTERFSSWYESTINLPGRWYLQVIKELFKENKFVKGEFIALGKKVNPKTITCPLYLIAGEEDDITPQDQVFNAQKYFGTPADLIKKDLAKGGHIGLFMGIHALADNWLRIAKWIKNI